MKNIIISILFLLPVLFVSQTRNAEGKVHKLKIPGSDTSSICLLPDLPASFPGGIDSMNRFLIRNIQYPWQLCVEGTCYVRFTVQKDGSVINAQILRGIPGCPECDKEALRLISKMPKFNPAQKKGEPVKIMYNVPIKFNIS